MKQCYDYHYTVLHRNMEDSDPDSKDEKVGTVRSALARGLMIADVTINWLVLNNARLLSVVLMFVAELAIFAPVMSMAVPALIKDRFCIIDVTLTSVPIELSSSTTPLNFTAIPEKSALPISAID